MESGKKIIDKDILILGGGITSLALASFLNQSKDFIILESSDRVGGYCKTNKINDYVWDYSGHFFHFKNNDIKNHITKNINCEILEIEKISKIFYKNKFIDFPFQFNIDELEKEEFIECLVDLYQAKNQQSNCSNFKEFVYNKLGKSICDKFIIPYNEKLYTCDLNTLDHNCMGRFFPSGDFDSTMKNISGLKYSSYNDKFIYPVNGAGEFVKSICQYIAKDKILLNEEVISINTHDKIVETNKNIYKFNKLISTLPFDKFLELCNNADTSKLNNNKVVVFNIGFDSPSDIDAHWIYFPQDEVFYRVGFYNNILNQPKMSLYVEIGLNKNDTVIESRLLKQVVDDLKKVGIIKHQKIQAHQMLILNPAYVHINKESNDIYEKWCNINNPLGIYSIGRYGSWTYCSIEDNIIQSKEISQKL